MGHCVVHCNRGFLFGVNNYRYMDLKPWLCYTHGDGEVYMKDEHTTDGLHFSASGYDQWIIYLSYDIN